MLLRTTQISRYSLPWPLKLNLDFSHRATNLRNLHTLASEDSRLEAVLRPDYDIYVSTSINPYFNLSFEDWLFRHSPESKPLLLIYRDAPCAVIGRHQNPWTELNFPALRAANIPFLRRRSGGGTVYHDLGNTNFSIHLPRSAFDRHATGELVLRAVRSLGINAHLNDRHDVCVGPEKVSGSAYKIVNKRAYHHGTMLIATQLDALGDILRPQSKNIVTKGVESVRSPVCNLQKHSTSATHDTFTRAVAAEFRAQYDVTSEPFIVTEAMGSTIEYIRSGIEELKTWEWSYSNTPEFTQKLTYDFPWASVTIEIHSKSGVILDLSLSASESLLSDSSIRDINAQCQAQYIGRRYGFLHDKTTLVKGGLVSNISETQLTPVLRDIDQWIVRSTSVDALLAGSRRETCVRVYMNVCITEMIPAVRLILNTPLVHQWFKKFCISHMKRELNIRPEVPTQFAKDSIVCDRKSYGAPCPAQPASFESEMAQIHRPDRFSCT